MKLYKKYDFKKAFILACAISLAVILIGFQLQLNANKTYLKEQKGKQELIQEGWEIGYFKGQIDGYNSAYDEFYDKLSTNPKVSYLFKKYFPDQETARVMRAISLAESHGIQTATNTANRNGSKDFGFFQINTVHRKKGETIEQFNSRMNNLESNFQEARRVLDTQGLTAWSTYTNGKYLSYIK